MTFRDWQGSGVRECLTRRERQSSRVLGRTDLVRPRSSKKLEHLRRPKNLKRERQVTRSQGEDSWGAEAPRTPGFQRESSETRSSTDMDYARCEKSRRPGYTDKSTHPKMSRESAFQGPVKVARLRVILGDTRRAPSGPVNDRCRGLLRLAAVESPHACGSSHLVHCLSQRKLSEKTGHAHSARYPSRPETRAVVTRGVPPFCQRGSTR